MRRLPGDSSSLEASREAGAASEAMGGRGVADGGTGAPTEGARGDGSPCRLGGARRLRLSLDGGRGGMQARKRPEGEQGAGMVRRAFLATQGGECDECGKALVGIIAADYGGSRVHLRCFGELGESIVAAPVVAWLVYESGAQRADLDPGRGAWWVACGI